jgi:peptidoglycan hydrolase-like protein with peptidoglycan-binding domain
VASSSTGSGPERQSRSRFQKIAGVAMLAVLVLVMAIVPAVILAGPGIALAADTPTITSITPAVGWPSGGDTAVITGTGFVGLSGASAVTFGGVDATSYTVDSGTKIIAVTPARAAGTVRVQVTAAGGSTADTAADDFAYVNRYDDTDAHLVYAGSWAPFTRSSAWQGAYDRANTSGASVTMTFAGTRLDWIAMTGTTTGKADVYLDGVWKQTVDLSHSTALYQQRVWSTGTVSNGTHTVKIAWYAGNSTGDYITVDAVDVAGALTYAAPVITSLSPASSWTGGGQSVVIAGTGFTGTSAVTFGGVPAAGYTLNSATKIAAIAPAHAAGAVQVQVTAQGGPTANTAADDFTYEDAGVPTITALSPAAGTSSGGNVVVITGTGFIGLSGASAVTFGGIKAASYTVDSSRQITATTPAHVTGTVRVQVVAAGGTTADIPADDFTYMNRYDDTDSRISYSGTWETYETRAAWGASYKKTKSASASATITFTGSRLDWIATEASTAGVANVYVDDVPKGTVDLYTSGSQHQQRVWSTGDLGGGVHKVKITWNTGNSASRYVNVDAIEVVGTLGRAGRIEQTDSRLAWSGSWGTYSASGASGGSYKRANVSGAAVTVTFHGTYLAWIATRGTTLGQAWVALDNGKAQSIDLSASAVAYQQKVWDTGPLTSGAHTVKIWWDDKNEAGKYVSVDAFDLQGTLDQAYAATRFEQTDSRLIFSGTWASTSASAASNGSYKSTDSAASSLIVTFSGVQLDWIATKGPTMGKVDVSVDGGPATTIDLYNATTSYQQKVWSTGALANGTHLVELCLNEDTPAGSYLSVDAFDIQGTLPSSSALTSAEIKWAEQRLADLSFRPGSIDGEFDTQTRSAVIAFQKWEGLSRTGTIGASTWTLLQTATRPTPTRVGATNPWIEVDKTKQVLLFCKDGQVVWTLPVSTGSASVGVITPSGTFAIRSKTTELEPCYLPLYVTTYQGSQIAIHGYPNVPTYPASHGCIRTQIWDQDALWPIVSVGYACYIY